MINEELVPRMMKDSILLTGATGFLGTELASRLIKETEGKIYALVRAADDEEAAWRLKSVWHHERELYEAVGTKVIPAAGDFLKPSLGLDAVSARDLQEKVSLVIHAGAEVGFRKSKEELDLTNGKGTENVLVFAGEIRKDYALNLVPVDYVADSVIAVCEAGEDKVRGVDLPSDVPERSCPDSWRARRLCAGLGKKESGHRY